MQLEEKIFYYNKEGALIPATIFGRSQSISHTQVEVYNEETYSFEVKTIQNEWIFETSEMEYLNLLNKLDNGRAGLSRRIPKGINEKEDRTGTGTYSIFGYQMRFNLQDGFPLLTTKKVHFKSIAHELLWFLKGDTNITYLKENGVSIWNEWADENGNLGRVYGAQWRDFGGIDQIKELIHSLKTNPNSRRHIVSAWNPVDVPTMALPPCHTLWQCYVANGKLSLQLYQRSADVFLGLPFNIASYALLIHLLAKTVGLEVGDLVVTLGDAHLYKNHLEQAQEQLSRTPTKLPTLSIKESKSIFDYCFEDIELDNYNPQPAIKAKVAI